MNQIDYYQAKLDFEIDAAELFAALQTDKRKIVVVDARLAAAAAEQIPMVINLPHVSLSNAMVRTLDSDKLDVCYCDGVGSNVSTKVAFSLAGLGLEVVELSGGLDVWKRDGYETETAQGVLPLDE